MSEISLYASVLVEAGKEFVDKFPKVAVDGTILAAKNTARVMAADFCSNNSKYGVASSNVSFYDNVSWFETDTHKTVAPWFAGVWMDIDENRSRLRIYRVSKRPDGYLFYGKVKTMHLADVVIQPVDPPPLACGMSRSYKNMQPQ